MISKAAALILALAMVFSGYSEEASAEDKLLEEIYNCAVYINDFNEAACIALEDVQLFVDLKMYYNQNNYNRLLIAEASMDFVIKEFENYKKKMNLLNVDEYLELMLTGVQVDDIIIMYESMDENYETYLQHMRSILSCIRGDMRFEPCYEYAYDMANVLISDMLLNQRIQCLSLNYLLTQVSNQEEAKKIWGRIFDECILMSNQSMSRYEEDPQAILDMIREEEESRTRSFEEGLTRASAHLQYADFLLGEFEKGDPVAQKALLDFEENSVWFPMGDWMRTENAAYEYMLEMNAEDGYIYEPWAWGFDEAWTWITCQYPPTETWITIENADKEAVLAYIQKVAGYGYSVSVDPPGDEAKQSDMVDIRIEKDGEYIVIRWREDRTTVFFTPLSVSLVPFRYIDLARAK